MKRKLMWLAIVTLILTLFIGVGIVQAQKSNSYNLKLNSLASSNYGGGTFTSGSYTMTTTIGSLVQVRASSVGYDLCTGFICQSDQSFFQLRLPALDKSPE